MKSYLLELKEGLIIALQAIRANKVRAALTTIGIVIGISSVVLMSTAIKGINNSFEKGISSLGADVLYIDKWAWFSNVDWWKMRSRKNITYEDFKKFKELAKMPLAVSPTLWTMQNIKYENETVENVFTIGTNQDYERTSNFTFESGRWFTEIESNGSRYVAVLGNEVAKNLSPRGNLVDRYIQIGGYNFKVVGVLDVQGSFIMGSFNPDKEAFIPIGTVIMHFASDVMRSVTINVRAPNNAMVEDTKIEAIGVMRKIRGLSFGQEDDFSVNQQEGLTQTYDKTVGVIQIAGFFITGLSLFVGAIGIMNIMFVSVKERTKEIGIRKAIGAKRRTIMRQFLYESVIICLLGGLIGLIVAIILSKNIKSIFTYIFFSTSSNNSVWYFINYRNICGISTGIYCCKIRSC
jgi:putative ABC transport system permease protein